MQASLSGIQIISLVGYQGSGKSTIGQKLARLLRTDMVEVSSIVKDLHKTLPRALLPTTAEITKHDPNWLSDKVAVSVEKASSSQNRSTVVLTGVREQTIHTKLTNKGATIFVFELVADPGLRCQRVRSLGKVKNEHEFVLHELAERKMGLQDVCDRAPFRVPTSDETEPPLIAKAIVEKLLHLGVIF